MSSESTKRKLVKELGQKVEDVLDVVPRTNQPGHSQSGDWSPQVTLDRIGAQASELSAPLPM